MASAADRVFAITEILEQILIDCKLNTRGLFRLQTVNRSFDNAINGSKTLLRIMEIRHKPPEQKRHRVSNPILWLQQLELQVSYYRIEVLAPQSPKNNHTGWKMNVHVKIELEGDCSRVSEKEVGVKSSKFTDPLDGSWRRMKIVRFPVVVEVPIYVTHADVSYEETTTDPTGEMTLGGLVDLVDAVRIRSEDQHRAKAAEFQLMKQMDEVEGEERTETAGCPVS